MSARSEALRQVREANAQARGGVEIFAYRDHGRWFFGYSLPSGPPVALGASTIDVALAASHEALDREVARVRSSAETRR